MATIATVATKATIETIATLANLATLATFATFAITIMHRGRQGDIYMYLIDHDSSQDPLTANSLARWRYYMDVTQPHAALIITH